MYVEAKAFSGFWFVIFGFLGFQRESGSGSGSGLNREKQRGGNGRARTKAKAKAKPSTEGRRARGGAGGSVSRLVGRPVVSFFPVG